MYYTDNLGYTQWRIQDFPKGGREPSKGGAWTHNFAQFSKKTAWNWKNLDAEGGGGACVPHAPLRSATDTS